MEEKIKELAQTIVEYAIDVQKNERVLITYQSMECTSLIKELIKRINSVGGIAFTNLVDPVIGTILTENTTDERIELIKKQHQFEIDNYDSFIIIKYNINDYENKNVDNLIIKKIGNAIKDIQSVKINERKWVLLNYPSLLDSYKAHMKIEEFKNYALDVMTVDYKKLSKSILPLKQLMDQTDKVRLLGPNTDLTFSIKKIGSIPCIGRSNLPDGEIYTAPVKDSVNGIITYNVASPHSGIVFEDIRFEFLNGKIINASCKNNTKELNKILDTDDGSRYIGEFALGFNPQIKYPMGDILYDEKIIGSLHFTPGKAYHDAYNGNDSSIHWDLVLIQRSEYGGGEIYFDNVLIRKDGKFILEELNDLN
ncbi:MAG: aminopeptidase [Bacilli bacterium]